jgi:glucose-1-phosphate thymidylyltransferase
MGTHKAVVLAAGKGSRMRQSNEWVELTPEQEAAADAGLKCLMPVGRPFLDYVLSALADGGITDVCIVVAAGDDRIRTRYTRDVQLNRLRIEFVEQSKPRGTADAIDMARGFVANDAFIVVNGDNLYTAAAITALAVAGGNGIAAYRAASLVEHSNIPPERLRAFALVEPDIKGFLGDVIEKPDDGMRMVDESLISMNLWTFTPTIFSACARVEPSARGELEIADAIRIAMQRGVTFHLIVRNDGVLDLTERADIAEVTERLSDVSVSL